MDSSITHIHGLPDDVLLKILWPYNESTTCKSASDDDLWSFVGPRPKYRYSHATPDERWCELRDSPMPIPPASADAARNLLIASICRRWRRLAQSHVASLLVKEDRIVSHHDVLYAVACFPNLTHLHLSDCSVETLDDAFLAGLASSCPRLRALHVGKWMIEEAEGRHERNDRKITESGLDYLFCHCPQLEHLSLYCLHENLNLPASFFQLQHLSILVLSNASILKAPDVSSLSSLTALSIDTFSLRFDQLSSLLQLTTLTHLSLPDQIRLASADPPAFSLAQLLPSLESLKFGLHDARFSAFSLLGSPHRFLKRLELTHCYTQQQLPNNIGDMLPRLQELSISECKRFNDLTDQFTSLTCLESLTISTCSIFTLPENFGDLPALNTLALHELPLLRLLASLTRLASLKTFFLVGCERVAELPPGFGCLTALKTLSLAWLPSLNLPEDLGGLTNLQTFHLAQIRQEQLPSSFTQLASLTRLELDRCGIVDLPEGMAEMTNLRELYIRNCPFLKELPESVSARFSLDCS